MNNITVRTLSGIGFVCIMVACLLFNEFLFAGLFALIISFMLIEFYRITIGAGFKLLRGFAIAAGVILFFSLFLVFGYNLHPKYITLAFLPVILIVISSLFLKDRSEFCKVAYLFTGLLYIAIPLGMANILTFNDLGEFDGRLLLCFFIIIWSSDVGGFVIGNLLGKNGKKLMPEVSPKKSWAGFWGGIAFSLAAAAILHYSDMLLPEHHWVHSIVLALLMDVFGVFGDLFESQWKRLYDLKDSGTIIPGHGGMLDRFDSTLMALPAGLIYLSLVNIL